MGNKTPACPIPLSPDELQWDMDKNSYKEQIKTLAGISKKTPAPHGVLYKIVHRLWVMEEAEKKEAARLIIGRMGEMRSGLMFDAIAALSGMDQNIISNEELLDVTRQALETLEDPLPTDTAICLSVSEVEMMISVGRGVETIISVIEQTRGSEKARENVRTLAPHLMHRAVGYGRHVGQTGVTEIAIDLVNKYAPNEKKVILENMGHQWAEFATTFDDNYGYSEVEPTKDALDCLVKEGVDLTGLFPEVNKMFGSDRKNTLTSWLLDAGASWKAVCLDRAGPELYEIVQKYARKEREKLLDLAMDTQSTRSQKSTRPSM